MKIGRDGCSIHWVYLKKNDKVGRKIIRLSKVQGMIYGPYSATFKALIGIEKNFNEH